jgi:nucleoside phosphorylase/signal transduction histidine kinase
MIGVITALEKEYVAVEAMLDNIQYDYIQSGDGAGRRYCFGEIPDIRGRPHHVILAMADVGNNQAAIRATQLLLHFPKIETLVMVGIAGGVPHPTKPDEHVRLGDIVVSNHGGVIQYDFNKETYDFETEKPVITIRNHPRPPSAALLEAARFMNAAELRGADQWSKSIERGSHLWGSIRPSDDTDRLANSSLPASWVSHPFDPRRLAGRPRVFLGPIASANKLLKNPTLRDSLRDAYGVKAVEMEASGISDATWYQEKSYLIVRGICDYCDGNKNDAWQAYAAVVAAAFTRGLLETLPSHSPKVGDVQVLDTAVDPIIVIDSHSQLLENPPYKGLEYFNENDAALFFGREALTTELASYVHQHEFLAVIGNSGSGKSSLLRSGLVPLIRQKNSAVNGGELNLRWLIRILTPGRQPLEALAISMTNEQEPVTTISALIRSMQSDSASLRLQIRKLLNAHGFQRALILVDQFEELFTLCRNEDERKSFIANLISASRMDGLICIVIALRADFFHHYGKYDELMQIMEARQKYIGKMSRMELQRAIEQPAFQAGLSFEPTLVNIILDDIGDEPGALPLLSHALLATWKQRKENTMTLSGYKNAGQVQRAIATTAEALFNEKLTPVQQTIARSIFLCLTELGEGSQDTRRRVTRNELYVDVGENPEVNDVLRILINARLITSGNDSFEVAHEALIKEWPALRSWLEESREEIRIHRQLSIAAAQWNSSQDLGDLYRGAKLNQAIEWAAEYDDKITDLEREFLLKSRQISQVEAERQQIRDRTTRSEERQLLQDELHNILNMLSFTTMIPLEISIDELIKKGDTELADKFGKILRSAQHTRSQLSFMLQDIREPVLVEQGLLAAIQLYLASTSKLPVSLTIPEDIKLSKDIELGLYRICQEAIINIAKYSGVNMMDSGKIIIALDKNEKGINLIIEDNGKGFLTSEVQTKGLGLQVMRNWAERIGGKITINSDINRGTRIKVILESRTL